MRSKKSMIEKVNKISHVVCMIVGPVCAGLSWFSGLTSKLRGKGRIHQSMVKSGKGKSGMFENILKIVASIVIIAGIGSSVYVLIQKAKKWFADKTDPVVKGSKMIPQKVENRPVPTPSYQTLVAKKRDLEQKMASVTSGKAGLFMLQEMMRDAASEGTPDIQYREAYRINQDKLREYMKDYRALLNQAANVPEEERGQFEPDKDIERYQELLDEKV